MEDNRDYEIFICTLKDEEFAKKLIKILQEDIWQNPTTFSLEYSQQFNRISFCMKCSSEPSRVDWNYRVKNSILGFIEGLEYCISKGFNFDETK